MEEEGITSGERKLRGGGIGVAGTGVFSGESGRGMERESEGGGRGKECRRGVDEGISDGIARGGEVSKWCGIQEREFREGKFGGEEGDGVTAG